MAVTIASDSFCGMVLRTIPSSLTSLAIAEFAEPLGVETPARFGVDVDGKNRDVLVPHALELVARGHGDLLDHRAAFADDDSEYRDEVGRSFELFPLEKNTEENVKQAMINGTFFAASKYQKTTTRQNEIEGDGLVPLVTNIEISGNKITVECDKTRGCDTIEWVADGKVIKSDNSGSCKYTLDLNEYQDELGCYVRFVLKSAAHGVTYSQPFELRYEGRVDKEIPASPIPDNIFGKIFWMWYQRLSVTLIDLIGEKINSALGNIPKIAAE